MLFNSLQYLFFFPAVTSIYFVLPHRFRWMFLLFASYYFYMSWVPTYAVLIVISTIVSYTAAIAIAEAKSPGMRKLSLTVCLVVLLGILGVYKYYNFFTDSLRDLFSYLHLSPEGIPTLKLLLPVGISFYTFQKAGYVIDVYRERVKPERHLGIYALYSSFFPQLVAGPIERSFNLLPQFRKRFEFDYDRVTDGLKIMAWGFFLKVVIADNLAVYVNGVYNDVHHHSGLSLILATYFFAFQIFCDFAGYTEIAIGTAKVMGFDLMENFERPYFAKSIPEFWRRWHISLSSWFRDYLYIPLGGNRVSEARWCFNIMVVFLVCGLWHGASWTFVIWGGLHGMYMAASRLTMRARTRFEQSLGLDPEGGLMKFAKVLITFNLVCLGWIFFRANNVGDAFYVLTHLFTGFLGQVPAGFELRRVVFYVILIAFLMAVHLVQRRVRVRDYIYRQPMHFRWAGYMALVVAIFFLGRFEGSDFIYFQF